MTKVEKLNAEAVRPPLDDSIFLPPEGEEMVSYRLPRAVNGEKGPLFVSIHGRTFNIRRGALVKIPRYVAEFLDAHAEEEEAIARRMDEMEEEFDREAQV